MSPRRAMLTITAGVVLTACTTWQRQAASPVIVLQERQPDRIRVTLDDQSLVILEEPVLKSDSIAGRVAQAGDTAVALRSVVQVETREANKRGTAGAIVLVGVLVYVASQACFGLVSPCGGG